MAEAKTIKPPILHYNFKFTTRKPKIKTKQNHKKIANKSNEEVYKRQQKENTIGKVLANFKKQSLMASDHSKFMVQS